VTLNEQLTLGLAAVGAVLGVINTWHQINQGRVKLRVIPRSAVRAGNGAFATSMNRHLSDGSTPCIEVVNLSSFPVTVTEVGYTIPGDAHRVACPNPVVIDSKPWPRRLEPRESVTAYIDLNRVKDTRIGKAYAHTDCGVTRFGNSPALKQMKEYLAEVNA
jgi:hypothetical protein